MATPRPDAAKRCTLMAAAAAAVALPSGAPSGAGAAEPGRVAEPARTGTSGGAPSHAGAAAPGAMDAPAGAPSAEALSELCARLGTDACREVLVRRLVELRTLVHRQRGETAPAPSLAEAGGLASDVAAGPATASPDRRSTGSTDARPTGAADGSGGRPAPSFAAQRLAWLGHHHRWAYPIPPELQDAIGKAWTAARDRPAERDVLADAAMTLGHRDALDHLVGRLGQDGLNDLPPPDWTLRRHTDGEGTDAQIHAWFAARGADLHFDPFLRRWTAAPGSPSPDHAARPARRKAMPRRR